MTTPTRLTDERLAWLAAKDYCYRQASAHGSFFWFWVIVSLGRVAYLRKENRGQKMKAYAVAVDDVARELNPQERAHLRATNTLPDWFLPRVDAAFKQLQKANF